MIGGGGSNSWSNSLQDMEQATKGSDSLRKKTEAVGLWVASVLQGSSQATTQTRRLQRGRNSKVKQCTAPHTGSHPMWHWVTEFWVVKNWATVKASWTHNEHRPIGNSMCCEPGILLKTCACVAQWPGFHLVSQNTHAHCTCWHTMPMNDAYNPLCSDSRWFYAGSRGVFIVQSSLLL